MELAKEWLPKLWGLKHFYTPFPLPVSLDKKNFHKINDEYICSLKSDGERCALLFCWDDDGSHVIRVNRRNECKVILTCDSQDDISMVLYRRGRHGEGTFIVWMLSVVVEI